MRKIPGVKTVRVSLNEGLTVLDLNAGNTITLDQLRRVLKNSGFVSKEARLEANGTAAADAAGVVFVVAGSGEKFAVLPAADQSAYDELSRRLQVGSAQMQLKGVATVSREKEPRLIVESVR